MPVKVVSGRLGHESPASLKPNARVLPGMQAEAAAAVAAMVQAAG